MPLQLKQPDAVTREYIEAHRLGVLIRTPIENVAFFKAEHKSVVAYTKNNGSFVLQIPLWRIEETLQGMFLHVHRSHLVQRALIPGASTWRTTTCRQFEIITSVRRYDGLIGLCPHTIPIARRLTGKIKAVLNEKPHRQDQQA